MPTVPDAFIEWVTRECEDRHWSWNYASERAGLARGSISAWVNQEKRPGIKSCKALARLFRKRPVYVLQLAGHLPKPVSTGVSPEALGIAYSIDELGHPLKESTLQICRDLIEAMKAKLEGEE